MWSAACVSDPDNDPLIPMSASSPPAAPSAYGPQGRSPWLDVDWRAHQHWTIINDSPVNVIELGEGPPLLFVHGLSGSWPNWLEQLPVFARTHRVIALDLPGFGRSPMPTRGYLDLRLRPHARCAARALGVDAAAVVGNSMGGFVSAELAIDFPQRVERLVLVSAAGLSTYRDPRGLRELRRMRRMERPAAAFTGWVAAHADTLARRPGLRNAALGLIAATPTVCPRRSPPSRSAAPASPASSRRCRPTSSTTSATASPRSPAPR